MKPVSLLAKQAYVSILGALGQGAPGTPSNNAVAILNAAPVTAGTTARFDTASFTSRTGKVLVLVEMTLSKNSGTLAAGDVVTFTMVRDSGGSQATIGPQCRATAATNGSDVIAFGALDWIDTVTPGAAHTWGIVATITGGHTGGILTDEVSVTVVDI